MKNTKIRFLILILLFVPLLLVAENKSESCIIDNTSTNSVSGDIDNTLENTHLGQSSSLSAEFGFAAPVAKFFIVLGLLGLIFLAIYNWHRSSKKKE